MKALLIFIPFLLSCADAMALKLTGTVLDSEHNPIEFAGVSAFVNDSIAGGGVTDTAGCFTTEIPDRCNSVRVSYIGHTDAVLSPGDGNLGNIILQQRRSSLKELVVKAPLIRREADRIVLNIAANPLSANKDVHDLLKTAPGVWATDNSLSIYGQSGTTVYIDERKINLSGAQLMTYLHSIQSSAVASIEIIPKAGAEFNASSAGGVIWIKLKRNRIDGLSGTTGLSTTFGKYKTWINPFVNLGLHSRKWTVNLSGNMNGSPSDRHITHEISDNSNSDISLAGMSRHKAKTIQGNLSLGIFLEPTDKDRIGIQFDYNPDRNNSTASSRTNMAAALFEEHTQGLYLSDYRFHNVNIALNYVHSLDDKGSLLKWIANYNYQYSATDENNRMQWCTEDRDSTYLNGNSSRYNIFDTELSLQKNFKQGYKLNTGIKYTRNDVEYDSRHFHFLNGKWISNDLTDYESHYKEDIAAAYATFNAKTGRWFFKAGLRGEYYHISGLKLGQSNFYLFPNANVAFSLTERGEYTVALGYYRNIRRPSFWSLNPTVRQVSDYSYSVGNPNLQPSHIDAVSLDFVLAGRFTVAAGYSLTKRPIRQMFISNPDHPERMYLTWGNTGKERSGFIHGDGFVNVKKWWNLYASLTYAVTSQRLSDLPGYDTFGYLQAVASTSFILPYSFTITLNGFYQTKMKVGNITVYPILNINPSIQKRFGKHWSLSLGLENVLQRKGRIRATSSGYDRLTFTKQYMTAKLGVSYSFNSGENYRSPQIEKNIDGSRLKKE